MDKVALIRIAGVAASIAGMIASNYVGKKDQEKTLEKLVKEHTKSK